jgi:hypothetical protein
LEFVPNKAEASAAAGASAELDAPVDEDADAVGSVVPLTELLTAWSRSAAGSVAVCEAPDVPKRLLDCCSSSASLLICTTSDGDALWRSACSPAEDSGDETDAEPVFDNAWNRSA